MGDLMAQVEEARNRHEESQQQLLAASGAAKGIAAAAWIENRRLSRLPPLPSLEERLRQGRANSSPRSNPGARLAAGRINQRAWDEHLRHRAKFEGGRFIPQVSWKDPTTGKNARLFPGPRWRRPDGAYLHPDGRVTVLEYKLSDLTDTPETRAQAARDLSAMNQGLPIGNNRAGFLSPVDNVVYPRGLPVLGAGGNTALAGAGEIQEHVLIEPRSPGTSLLRGAGRALGPVGVALDAYALTEAWDADGGQWGENVTSTAGGVAGGWAGAALGAKGGAAAGATIGAFFGGVGAGPGAAIGAVVGGIGGGVIGSEVGSEIADEVGDVAEGIGEGIGNVAEGIGSLFD